MNRQNLEFYVGLFVVAGLFCVGYLIMALGEFSLFDRDRYTIHGYFSSASGLKPGAPAEMAGVKVGHVAKISIDMERLVAKVTISIDAGIEFSDDSIASIKTSGIIGEKYIDISPGGSDMMLESGDEIENTESSLDIESLVRRYIFKDANP